MSWRLNDELDILHFHQLSFIQLHEVIYSAGDWINTGWWMELVFWVMSVMKERPMRGPSTADCSTLRSDWVVLLDSLTCVCPVWLAGQCQLIISPSHDLHGNVLRLINAAELAASPFLLEIANERAAQFGGCRKSILFLSVVNHRAGFAASYTTPRLCMLGSKVVVEMLGSVCVLLSVRKNRESEAWTHRRQKQSEMPLQCLPHSKMQSKLFLIWGRNHSNSSDLTQQLGRF